MIARLKRAATLDAAACCFHQDLWICAVAMLGHCSKFKRDPRLLRYKAAELRVQSCSCESHVAVL